MAFCFRPRQVAHRRHGAGGTGDSEGAREDIPLQYRKTVDNMAIGGRELPAVTFLMPEQFAGYDAAEDGILGIGALVTSGQAIIDFPLERFPLIETKN